MKLRRVGARRVPLAAGVRTSFRLPWTPPGRIARAPGVIASRGGRTSIWEEAADVMRMSPGMRALALRVLAAILFRRDPDRCLSQAEPGLLVHVTDLCTKRGLAGAHTDTATSHPSIRRPASVTNSSLRIYQAHQRVLDPFPRPSGEGPRARLSDDVERAAHLEDLVARVATGPAVKVEVDRGISDAQVPDGEVRKPRRKVRIQEQQIERRVRVEFRHRLDQAEDARGRPSLRPVGVAIHAWGTDEPRRADAHRTPPAADGTRTAPPAQTARERDGGSPRGIRTVRARARSPLARPAIRSRAGSSTGRRRRGATTACECPSRSFFASRPDRCGPRSSRTICAARSPNGRPAPAVRRSRASDSARGSLSDAGRRLPVIPRRRIHAVR